MTEYAVVVNRTSWQIPEDHVRLEIRSTHPTLEALAARWDEIWAAEYVDANNFAEGLAIPTVIAVEDGDRRSLTPGERADWERLTLGHLPGFTEHRA